MRIVRKVDEIEDKFNNKIGNLLEDSWGMNYHITYNKCSFFWEEMFVQSCMITEHALSRHIRVVVMFQMSNQLKVLW